MKSIVQVALLVLVLCSLPSLLFAEGLSGKRLFFSAEERSAMDGLETSRIVASESAQESSQNPDIRLDFLGLIAGKAGVRSFWSVNREERERVLTVNFTGKAGKSSASEATNRQFTFKEGWIGESQAFSIRRTDP